MELALASFFNHYHYYFLLLTLLLLILLFFFYIFRLVILSISIVQALTVSWVTICMCLVIAMFCKYVFMIYNTVERKAIMGIQFSKIAYKLKCL